MRREKKGSCGLMRLIRVARLEKQTKSKQKKQNRKPHPLRTPDPQRMGHPQAKGCATRPLFAVNKGMGHPRQRLSHPPPVTLFEKSEIDCIGHRLIAVIIWMEMVF